VKKQKFIEKSAKRSKVTVEHLLKHHDIVRCRCDDPKCPGWMAIYKFRKQRVREGNE
jgi:hypothetical protein